MSKEIHKVLVVKNLYKIVQTVNNPIPILEGVDLSVNAGESIAIVGVSGSGKTTLLSLLAGLDIPTNGEIYLNDKPLHRMDEDARAQCRLHQVGFIFQNFEILPHLTAIENVMLPLELSNQSQAKEKAKNWLKEVGLSDRLKHFPRELSGGEQQRVAIARAFATGPAIIFADEPTGSLDTNTGKKIIDLIFKLNQDLKTTLIIVTHDNQLAQYCDRQFLLESGKLTVC